MNRLDKSISVAALGLIAPVALMQLFWWGSIPFIGESAAILYFALACASLLLAFQYGISKKAIQARTV